MKWFKEETLEEFKKLVDVADAKGIRDLFWKDFKNNATNVFLAYVYAKKNNKDPKAVNALEAILSPKGKTGPLEFNDVISELYHNVDSTEWTDIKNILMEDKIPFQLKDGQTLSTLYRDPQLKQLIEKHPEIISKYMPHKEKKWIEDILFNSNNYADVVFAMSDSKYKLDNTKTRAYSKAQADYYFSLATRIKNIDLRKRYLKEYIIKSGIIFENLFNDILKHYEAGTWTAEELPDVIAPFDWTSTGNGYASALIYKLHEEGKYEIIKEIIKKSKLNIINSLVLAARFRTGNKPEYAIENWIIDYVRIDDIPTLVDFVRNSGGDNILIKKIIETFPTYIDKIPEDMLPEDLQSLFIF